MLAGARHVTQLVFMWHVMHVSLAVQVCNPRLRAQKTPGVWVRRLSIANFITLRALEAGLGAVLRCPV